MNRKRPKRDTTRLQAQHPWKRQIERNIFYRPRGWWHEAYSEQRSVEERARWRQFFGWPPPLDTARLTEILAATLHECIADVVTDSNALLMWLR